MWKLTQHCLLCHRIYDWNQKVLNVPLFRSVAFPVQHVFHLGSCGGWEENEWITSAHIFLCSSFPWSWLFFLWVCFPPITNCIHPNWTHYSPCFVDTSFSLELPPTLSSLPPFLMISLVFQVSACSPLFQRDPPWQASTWGPDDLQSPFWGQAWLCLDPV